MNCPDPHCACIPIPEQDDKTMTTERADDKCEKCGVKLLTPATDADFEDIIVCPFCESTGSAHVAEYYIYDNESSK